MERFIKRHWLHRYLYCFLTIILGAIICLNPLFFYYGLAFVIMGMILFGLISYRVHLRKEYETGFLISKILAIIAFVVIVIICLLIYG